MRLHHHRRRNLCDCRESPPLGIPHLARHLWPSRLTPEVHYDGIMAASVWGNLREKCPRKCRQQTHTTAVKFAFCNMLQLICNILQLIWNIFENDNESFILNNVATCCKLFATKMLQQSLQHNLISNVTDLQHLCCEQVATCCKIGSTTLNQTVLQFFVLAVCCNKFATKMLQTSYICCKRF